VKRENGQQAAGSRRRVGEDALRFSTRRALLIGLTAIALAAPLASIAQQSGKMARIGWLESGSPETSAARIKAFQQGLSALGHIEGKNIAFEFRFTHGKLEQHPALAAELVRLNPDCIFAVGIDATRALTQATKTIPIVMGTIDADPVKAGLAASLARPGGNVTGMTGIGWELAGKRLELLKEFAPTARRVAVIFDPRSPASLAHLRETESAARILKIQLYLLEVRDVASLDNSFRIAREKRADAMIIFPTGLTTTHRIRITELAIKSRLPAMYGHGEWVADGGLVSYGADVPEQFRRAAIYVDKILKGAKPGELPIEQPTKFELVVNLKTANQIGFKVPPDMMMRVDKVIK
jgi:putative ABC transport system substrate-binding protein